MRMHSNMVLLTLEQVAKLYGFTDKHKAKRIIGAPRASGEHRVMYYLGYVCWTEEQFEQLTALRDTTSRTCKRATVCRYAIRSSTAAMEPVRPVSRSSWECKGHWVTSRSRSACIFPTSMSTCCRPTFTPYVCPRDRQLLPV